MIRVLDSRLFSGEAFRFFRLRFGPRLSVRFQFLTKIPLVTFGIFSTVPAMSVLGITGLFQDVSACLFRSCKVAIDIVDVDVKTLGRLTQAFWISISRGRAAHHNNITAQFHCGMVDLAVSEYRFSELLEATGFR